MNPETKKMRERIDAYREANPQYAHYHPPERTHRKKRYTRSRLTGREVCYYCGIKLTRVIATYDHVIPLSRGGVDDYSNMVWCCKKCNHSKGDRTPAEWYADTHADTDKQEV